MDNQRDDFRLDDAVELYGELRSGLLEVPCRVRNVSAGGARVLAQLRPAPRTGAACVLTMRVIDDEHPHGDPQSQVELVCTVLDVALADSSTLDLRLQSIATGGSETHEQLAHLVREVERRRLARATGADEASTMVSDHDRRVSLREERRARFSKDSLRPGSDS